MIGLANESFIYINNTKCKALIDTGSMISTISEGMLNELTPPPELKSLDDFSLSISVAGGTTLPYLGYIEASIKVDFVEQDFMIPLLVVSLTDYNKNVPVIIGTNVIRLLDSCSMVGRQQTNIDKIPREWDIAFNSIKDEAIGQVYSTNKNPIKIKPLSVLNVSGLARSKTPEACTVVTESLSDDLSDVSVCPRVVNVKGSTCRVPVRIFNMTAKAMVIKPKTHLCSLNEVKVVRHVDVHSAESAVDEEKGSLSDQELSSLGINLESFDVPEDTKLRLKGLISRLPSDCKEVFSDVVQAICKSIVLTPDTNPAIETVCLSHDIQFIDSDSEILADTSKFADIDWTYEQRQDSCLSRVIDLVTTGHRLTKRQMSHETDLVRRLLREWDKLCLKDKCSENSQDKRNVVSKKKDCPSVLVDKVLDSDKTVDEITTDDQVVSNTSSDISESDSEEEFLVHDCPRRRVDIVLPLNPLADEFHPGILNLDEVSQRSSSPDSSIEQSDGQRSSILDVSEFSNPVPVSSESETSPDNQTSSASDNHAPSALDYVQPESEIQVRRSSRQVKPPVRFQDYVRY
ncbi:unnamed protein product [Mytilus edulis]|uniref:Uncharacterized protein n=1 Tax=Mytilus edulis TaxID=6550 RepID=A0A8S3VKP2_MYTED|nr:unnamed protein product [Mytilus edulis]